MLDHVRAGRESGERKYSRYMWSLAPAESIDAPSHSVRGRDAEGVVDGRGEVDVLDELRVVSSGRDVSGPPHVDGNRDRVGVRVALRRQAVLAEHVAVVRREDREGVGFAEDVESGEEVADDVVDGHERSDVLAAHVVHRGESLRLGGVADPHWLVRDV